MSKNREVSQFGSYISVDDTTKNVGIGTTLKISAGGIFVGNTEIVRPDGTWGGSSSGLVGAQGAQGFQGRQGAVGAQGDAGAQGATGAQGAQGAVGAQGAQGAVGAQGDAGAQGAQGAQGFQGRQGAVGAQGAQGSPGAQGATGAQGAQGATGPIGGSDTQVLFNSSGSTSGDAGLTFSASGNKLTLGSQHQLGLGAFSSPQRDALTGVSAGSVIYNSTTNIVQAYNGTSWVDVGSMIGPGNFIEQTTFSYTGSDQSFTIPGTAGTIDIYCYGAGGGSGNGTAPGGGGGFAQGTVPVPSIPGVSSLTVVVGSRGAASPTGGVYGGGGASGPPSGQAGGGGGYAGVFKGPVTQGNALVLAGGGGGSSYGGTPGGGGQGGGPTGGYGASSPEPAGGRGGTQVAGGAAGSPDGVAGSALQGGPGSPVTGNCGGGGGGYYGGGGGATGGQDGGGGGGSGYLSPVVTTSPRITPANSGGTPGDGSSRTSAGDPSPYFVSGIGDGGLNGVGEHGYIVIRTYT